MFCQRFLSLSKQESVKAERHKENWSVVDNVQSGRLQSWGYTGVYVYINKY